MTEIRGAVQFYCNLTYYRYSLADHDVEINGETFEASPMSRESFQVTQNAMKSTLKITVPRDNELLYISGLKIVTVWQQEGAEADWLTIWKGRVTGIEWKGHNGQFVCESIFTSMKRPGLRRKYQILCDHMLYDEDCGVNPTTYQVNTTVTSIDGSILTVDGADEYDTGYFVGGFIRRGPWYRTIIGHAGTQIQLAAPIWDLKENDEILMWPGCDHTLATCHSKFGNENNYGGCPWTPPLNPFSGLGNSLL